MAEALGIVGVLPAALTATKSLATIVKRYMDRDNTLQRLNHEVTDLSDVLGSLQEFIDSDAPILLILKGPVERCGQVCCECEAAMKKFSAKSKPGLRDWMMMEFERGNITSFMDTLASYKSTIMVGIGTLTMRRSKVAQETLEAYGEMVKNTSYNLELRLQRIEKSIAAAAAADSSTTAELGAEASASINLQDEREVTRQCLRICQDAQSYIESLHKEQFSEPQTTSPPEGPIRNQFEAELRTSQMLNENRTSIVQTISYLQQRLASVIMASNDRKPSQVAALLEEINVAKQCVEVCNEASSQIQQRKIHVIGEVIADDDTDQVVITTLADLFDVKKVRAKNRTTQLVGSMSDQTAQKMSEGRYSSRFGKIPDDPTHVTFARDGVQRSSSAPTVQSAQEGSSAPTVQSAQEGSKRSAAAETGRKPSPNEVRKRATGGDGGTLSADE
ncbi:hypothetical protein B0T16DRAFT_415488 [Cercophora newfieldiana]|uniref:Azaphilone pigments biosynthesis cluster protein L N-terminal domain-containing protein n=1 Tax=Cercophora newfieldiana TaxID=92897 RepID=A0AA39Y1L5_9PEZI|nr:hypothetical protein B0T16DRAFT_415488 [Cercophora newfieldiana]